MAMARMKDIAGKAGVAIATVSAVINGNGRIAPETRGRILSIATEMNYLPNAAALMMRNKPAVDVGVVVSDHNLFGLIMGELLREFAEDKLAYHLEQVSYNDSTARIPALIQNKFAAGILHVGYFSGKVREYASSNPDFPFVAVGEEWDYCVRTDFAAGVSRAIEHLAAYGHRDIAVSFGDQRFDEHRQVRRGLERAVSEYNINIAVDRWSTEIAGPTIPENMELCMSWAKSLLSVASRPTAVFCSGMGTAAAVVYAALEAGLRLPEQLSIISLGSPRDIHLIHPALSMVEHDHQRIAVESARMLKRRIAKSEVDNCKVMVEAKLVSRNSVARRITN